MHHARLALHCLTASLLTLPAAQASAACYTVYDAQGGVVQQADAPPASAAQAASVPAGGRVVLNGDACAREVAMAGQIAPAPARESASAPLLTHVANAAAAQAPYAVVGSGIAVVAPAHAEQVWERAPLVHPVVPAAGRPAVETVITEWADGRTDVEQRPVRTRRCYGWAFKHA